MTKEEYLEARLYTTENVISEIINIVGTSMPHCQENLYGLCEMWEKTCDSLDAELEGIGG